VTPGLLLSLSLASATAASACGLYLAWPRRMGPEEWVLRRRQALIGPAPARPAAVERLLAGDAPWARRLRWGLALARSDLRLLAAHGRAPTSEHDLAASLLRLAGLGAGGGLAIGTAAWLLGGREGLPVSAAGLAIAAAVLLPALLWTRLRRGATRARAEIVRRLPRLLTGARVLLESGSTPQQALSTAAGIQRDPAAAVLREVLLHQEVQRVQLADALDHVGRAYGLEPLQRLADAYRVGTQQGTRMADLVSEFALDLQRAEHAAYRERMTRAPILMTLPALVFFVLPLLALVLVLVFAPLESSLGQL
jgi:Flp pilus assembly protein TadB